MECRAAGGLAVTGIRLLTPVGSATSPCVFADFSQCPLQIDLGPGQVPTACVATLARFHDQVVAVNRHVNDDQLNLTRFALAPLARVTR